MNVLLVENPPELSQMISFCLSARYDYERLDAENIAEAILKLENNLVDLVIFNHTDDSTQLVEFLKSKGSQIPCIVCTPGDDNSWLDGINLIGSVGYDNIVEEIYRLTDEILPEVPKKDVLPEDQEGIKGGLNEDFAQINTELLLKANPLKANVYIRLRENHFIALFSEGDTVEKNDSDKYRKKKVNFLFVKREDTQKFITHLQNEIEELLKKDEITYTEAEEAVEMVQDTLQDMLNFAGITPETQALVKNSIAVVTKQIGKNPKLLKTLSTLTIDEKKYIPSHSTLLANISCAMSAVSDWSSEQTYEKLAMAAFFHDITLRNHELAEIQTTVELEEKKPNFTPAEIQLFQTHPNHAAALAKQFETIPNDVIKVIAQHHERPDGTGFPNQIKGKQITPLSALFIVAHMITNEVTQKKADFDLSEFINSIKDQKAYIEEPFSNILKILNQMNANYKLTE